MRNSIFGKSAFLSLLVLPWPLLAEVQNGDAAPSAENNPVAESLTLGAGVVSFTRPDYRGSREVSTLVAPAPFIDYFSRKLELSREGLRVNLFDRENLELRISASATLPGDDTDEGLRSGMPELLPTVGLGPSLDWLLDDTGAVKWKLSLPVRGVVATDLGRFDFIGWEFSPHLEARREFAHESWELSTTASVGPLLASGNHHRYYYEVAPRFSTVTRPEYMASGGYSGARATLSLGLKRGPWLLGIAAGYDALDGANFVESPLVETRSSLTVGVALFYKFWKWERHN